MVWTNLLSLDSIWAAQDNSKVYSEGNYGEGLYGVDDDSVWTPEVQTNPIWSNA